MALFEKVGPLDKRFDELLEQLGELKVQVTEMRSERSGTARALRLEKDISTLKEELEDLRISKARIEEENAKDRREVEHMVGLERKRGEFEVAKAKQEATLQAREENLKADKARFDEHIRFVEERFDQQFESLNDLMGKFLERMPTTRQLISVNGRPGGDDGEDD